MSFIMHFSYVYYVFRSYSPHCALLPPSTPLVLCFPSFGRDSITVLFRAEHASITSLTSTAAMSLCFHCFWYLIQVASIPR